MKIKLGAALAATILASSAPAVAQEFANPTQLLNGFNATDLSALAGELGYTSQSMVFNNGVAGLAIATPEGYQFFVSPTVCNPVCHGLDIYALFGTDAETPLTMLNEFNGLRAMTKAFSVNQTIVLSRYVIGDFGMPRGNVASEFINFVGIAVTFADFLVSGGQNTVSLKIETPVDDAARVPAVEAAFAPGEAHGAPASSPFLDALIASDEAKPFRQ